jgi:hypothetical protein
MGADYTVAFRATIPAMTHRLALGALLLLATSCLSCSNASSDAFPRATRAPDVRCLEPAQPGSPVQDPYARPMFYFFCMQSP